MARLNSYTSLREIHDSAQDPFVINVMDAKYGAAATGDSSPLSDIFDTLEAAQAYYPKFASGIDSLNMQRDTCAIMEAYLDAMELFRDNDITDKSAYYVTYQNSINPALIIPRRYYRVDLDKVWFYGNVDIHGEGAVLIGHNVEDSGKNYYQYPTSGQEPAAGAILSIGGFYDASNHPVYIDQTGGFVPYSVNFYLPDVVSDHGYKNYDITSPIDEVIKGTGVRLGGMLDCNIHMGKISGMLRYGLLWHPLATGANFNRVYLRMIHSCLYSIKFATSQAGYIIANQMYGGWARGGTVFGTGGETLNSGIIVDFCYDPDQPGNYPYPSGYSSRTWKTGDLYMEGFSPEDPYIRTCIRFDFCNDIIFKKWRGERANFNTVSGIMTNIAWIPSGPKILVNNTTYGNVQNVRIDDWSHTEPDVQYITSSGPTYSNEYNYNPIAFDTKMYNVGNPGDLVRVQDEEMYNRRPGAGPIITSSDGKKAFRLMIQETGGSYSLTPQEVGLPACSIRASGVGDWHMLRDGLNHEPFQVPVSGWLEIKSYAGRSGQSNYDIYFKATRHIPMGNDYDEFEQFSYGWADGTDEVYYLQVGDSGVYNFGMSNYYFNTQVSGIDPYNGNIKNFTSPPFKNSREWYGAFYV